MVGLVVVALVSSKLVTMVVVVVVPLLLLLLLLLRTYNSSSSPVVVRAEFAERSMKLVTTANVMRCDDCSLSTGTGDAQLSY